MVIFIRQGYTLTFGATVGGNNMKHPDPKLHLQISLIKSVIRILAGGFLVYGMLVPAGIALIVAELLGVGEELV